MTSQDHDDWSTAGFSTRAIHVGQHPDPLTGAVIPPIHMSTTFKQDGVGGLRSGFEYSRSGNPTREVFETALAGLEAPGDREAFGFAFGSGLAASDCILRSLLSPGDHVVIPNDTYGGTYRIFDSVAAKWGLDYSVANTQDPASVLRAVVSGRTKLVWLETPTNPMLSIADISAISDIAHQAGAVVVVDNTFATPYLQQPLSLGADLVVHSVTKYLGGHSDVVGGAIVTRDAGLAEQIRFHQNAMGSVPSPFDCWLALRGVRTLGIRMDRHCSNARRIVDLLLEQSDVLQVFYPGLAGHPGHEIAARQMSDFGGMVSFRIAGGEEAARRLCAATSVFTLGESLGGVESLIELPAAMTHLSVAGSELEVPADLVRLSVGIEDVADLEKDLLGAIEGSRLGS